MELAKIDEVTSIESRHKREKKELLAQVQALKKLAKNDKTKKKDITIQIAKLETELESRHKHELDAVQAVPEGQETDLGPETENVVEVLGSDMPKLKISKAQKRRDKKYKLEKEREEEIKLQEKDNINGPRNIEMLEIVARLKKRNLKMYSIPSDGDCLFKAVSHQLESIHKKILSVDVLRSDVANYMKDHKNDFIPFMTHPETFEMLTDTEFKNYCDRVSNTKVWGGQLEIKALSNVLKCPISVIQATGPDSIEQGTEFEGPALTLTYHRHMYRLGEHYNSTIKDEAED